MGNSLSNEECGARLPEKMIPIFGSHKKWKHDLQDIFLTNVEKIRRTVCHNGEKTLEIFIIQGRDTKIQCRSKQCQNHDHKDHDHKDHTLRRIKCERWDESGVIIYHQNNKKHQCSCRLCFSGMITTITNQGFHRICLHDEVCIELTTEQTEFSDIVSVCVHVIISVHRFLGGGLRVSTHFEGKYIINALKDDLKKVFAVMLLCLQKICLLLHLRMTFISPLYPVTTHHHATRSQYCNALLSKVSSINSRKIQSLMLENWSRQILDSLENINFQGDAATVQVAIPGIKQMKSFEDHRNILEHYRAMVHAYFSEDCSVHSERKQEFMVENRHELLEKADTKRESEKNYDDNCDQFSDNIHSVLFPSLEIRSEQIAYPATQQLVLEPILNKFATPESTPSKHETMAVEFLRLCTMHDYPSTSGPSLLRLAQAGFYYEGNGNELVCFSCNIRKGTWNYHDSPREIHLRMSPNCKFLSQNGDGNIPIPREESTQDLPRSSPWVGGEVMADGPRAATAGEPANNTAHLASADCRDGQDQSVPPRRPMIVKHPEYANRATRLGSYANFPRHMKQHPADMTDAGFYYAGFGDCCRCYHCGIGLRNWDPEDNPWIEHARWSSECPYILKVKGQAFIDLVQEAARAAEMAQDEDSEGERDSVGSNGAVGSEKSGESNSSSGGSTGNSPAGDELVENNVAKTSEATVSKGVSSGDSGFGSGSTVQAQPIKAPLRTAAAQSLIHDEKIKPKYVTAAIEDLVKAEGWGAFTKENIRKYLKTNEENGKSAPSASNADPDVLKQQNKELKDLTVCKICLDEKVSIVFLPCGHLVACPQCAPALTKCPICRKNIKGTVRTNLVEKSAAK